METIENKVDEEGNNMDFGSVFRSMIPSLVVGTAAAAGCQEIASNYTSNPEAITLAGMVGQYVGAYGIYFPAYLYDNRDRLIEDGKVKWRDYVRDISSVMISDRIGNKVWAGAYGLTNELALRFGITPVVAGTISGSTSGLLYSTFTGVVAPKISKLIPKTRNVFSKIRSLGG